MTNDTYMYIEWNIVNNSNIKWYCFIVVLNRDLTFDKNTTY